MLRRSTPDSAITDDRISTLKTPNTKKIEGKLSSALQALKYRNFKLFYGGQFISITGNYIQTVAQAWLVYRLTGSSGPAGIGSVLGTDCGLRARANQWRGG